MKQSAFLNISFPDFTLPLSDPVLVFSLVLFIILLAPIILRRFRIPGIIGLIVAGVAIGPHGFNFLKKSDAIDLFGTVGLLYIMFLAGLELDMNEFRKNRHRSIVFGLFTFSIPLGIGIPVCYYFLDFTATASILVASMFATHTLVAYPIASRLGINKSEAVAIAVGGTIITDTAVLLILTLITGSVSGELNAQFWIRLVIATVVFISVVFLVFPPLTRWFFKNLEAEKTSQYIFVLALVFLSAFLAKMAGVEPIVGAFMAGLALNRLVPHTSPLMNRIEFVGNALFIPFFLISVGMLVDLRVLLKGPQALIVAGTLSGVALVGKWLAAYFTQKIFSYTVPQRNIIFGLSSAHAAATLAVILVGFNIGLLNENVLNGTIILILITCLVASFVTEEAGRKLAITESERKPILSDHPERILVPISNPATIEILIDLAIMLKEPGTRQPISALAVVQDDDEAQEKVISSNKMLERATIHASATDTKVQVVTRVDLNIASGITRTVKELLITTVIIGWSEKTRPIGKIFGTTLDSVLSATSQMIIVCKINHPINVLRRILIAAPSNAEFEQGFEVWVKKMLMLAGQTGTKIILFGAGSMAKRFSEVQQKLRSSVDVSHVEVDYLYKFLTLAKEVKESDLFVAVCARKNAVSHHNDLDEIPGKLERYFGKQNFVIIYPEQNPFQTLDKIITAEDLEISPIEESIQRMAKISKSIKRLWSRINKFHFML